MGGGGGGAPIARLNCLVESSGTTTLFIEGASPTTLSAMGGPPAEIPYSSDAQTSRETSWAAPSNAGRALEARSRESTIITVDSSEPLHLGQTALGAFC